MNVGEELFLLTPKGTEELRSRTYKLDFTARRILYLIQQGSTTTEAILQRAKFPHDTVIDSLRRLLGNKFVAVAASGAAAPRTPATRDSGSSRAPEPLRLKFGVSLSHARFALTDFCLDQFGMQGQDLVNVVNLCSDVISLQQVLDTIRIEVENRCPDRMQTLFACVREINETAT